MGHQHRFKHLVVVLVPVPEFPLLFLHQDRVECCGIVDNVFAISEIRYRFLNLNFSLVLHHAAMIGEQGNQLFQNVSNGLRLMGQRWYFQRHHGHLMPLNVPLIGADDVVGFFLRPGILKGKGAPFDQPVTGNNSNAGGPGADANPENNHDGIACTG